MYSAAENESTDLQSDEESSQESSDEGRLCWVSLYCSNFVVSDASVCLQR